MASDQDAPPARFVAPVNFFNRSLVSHAFSQTQRCVLLLRRLRRRAKEASRDDRSADLFDQLKADARVKDTEKQRGCCFANPVCHSPGFAKMRLLVEPKNRRAVSKERGNSTSLPFSPSQYRFWSAQARLRFETRTRRVAVYRRPAAQGATRFQPAGRTGPRALPT